MVLLTGITPVYGKHPDTGFNSLPPVYQVDPDEMVSGLLELNLTAPDSQRWEATGAARESGRRYQVIIVRTTQGKGQFIAEMGLASLWGVDQLHIPGEWVISAAKAMDVADEIRSLDMRQRLSLEPEDLYNGYFDMMEERIRDASNVSQFGLLHKTKRT